MNKYLKYFLFLTFIFLTSCQNIKDGLTGKKSETSDEFLVQKKNPLVLPPEFDLLPEPKDAMIDEEEIKNEEIELLLGTIDDESKKASDDNFKSFEDFILEKINQN